MNEEDGNEGRDLSDYARSRPPAEPRGGSGGRILRGCAIALGIAFLVLLFGVGACFLSF